MRLDRINDVLNQKLEKYKHECKIQEDDREFLVRQLVAIKKENSRLRREIDKITSVRVKNSRLYRLVFKLQRVLTARWVCLFPFVCYR